PPYGPWRDTSGQKVRPPVGGPCEEFLSGAGAGGKEPPSLFRAGSTAARRRTAGGFPAEAAPAVGFAQGEAPLLPPREWAGTARRLSGIARRGSGRRRPPRRQA